jgi:ribA/ribD-fused uncharacterized protein
MVKNNMILFWGGTFSQWFPSDFIIDGIKYVTAEQYMMARKAKLFGDNDAYCEIMKSKEPAYQKQIGRQVKGFKKNEWESICRQIVYDGNYAKFTQNPVMKEELMATGDMEIVEASPHDKIWGIGLHETDPRAWDKSTWKGTNWLGEAIMQVRETLKKEK